MYRVPEIAPARDAPELRPGSRLGRTVRFEQACARYGRDLVEQLAAYFQIGDELAYNVICDIRGDRDFGWQDFHAALDYGIRAVPDPPESLKDLLGHAERVPDWVDWEQLRRGSVAYWRPGPVVVVALTASIGKGFKSFAGMKPTIFTGRLIDEQRVGRRLVETLRYIAAVTTPDSMRRDSDGWKFSLRLRMLHASVRYGCVRSPAWDWDAWGLPINGSDNLAPPLEFSVGLAGMLEQVGVCWSPQERADIIALWKYVAYVLGTPEEILMSTEHDARRRLSILDELNHPPDDTNRLMLHSLVEFAAHNGIGYDPFPDWFANALSPEARRDLTYGLMYAWSDPAVRSDMEIPRNVFRHAVRLGRPAMRVRERLVTRSPSRDEKACLRMLDDFTRVVAVRGGEAPLADPDEIDEDIRRRAGDLVRLFRRSSREGR